MEVDLGNFHDQTLILCNFPCIYRYPADGPVPNPSTTGDQTIFSELGQLD